MKRLILLLLLQAAGLFTIAQKKFHPDSTRDMANYGLAYFHQDDSKILFAYRWVATNIRYNADKALVINRGIDSRAVIDSAFKRRKGVCENFSAIFTDICQKMGFESFVVDGYTKQNGEVDRQGHSWSAVKINNDWFLFDPTWDVGKSSDFKFFKKSGEDFIASHIPFDPMWQLLENPVSHEHFYRGVSNSNSSIPFHYADSIAMYFAMDSLERFQSSALRIEAAGLYNQNIKTHYKIVKSNLEIQRQEEELNWYNTAVNIMNDVTNQLNVFIDYRNNRFLPSKPDVVINEMLTGIPEKITKAIIYLDKVDQSEAVLVFGTGPAREQLQKLEMKLKSQEIFLKSYLTCNLPEREKFF